MKAQGGREGAGGASWRKWAHMGRNRLLHYKKLTAYLQSVMSHPSRHQRACVAFVTMILTLRTYLLGSRELQYFICGSVQATVACSVSLSEH